MALPWVVGKVGAVRACFLSFSKKCFNQLLGIDLKLVFLFRQPFVNYAF